MPIAAIQSLDQGGEFEEVFGPEQRTSSRNRDEWIDVAGIRPARCEAQQHAVLIESVDPLLTPAPAPVDELELAAMQRVERVRHAENAPPIRRYGCS